jgi:hypothetical protein
MRRWISIVRPDCLPRTASRGVRVGVAPGSMLYSAVSQPRPEPRSQGGTPSLTEAVQSTWVSPSSMRAEPAANFATAGVIVSSSRRTHPASLSLLASSPATPAGAAGAETPVVRSAESSAPPVVPPSQRCERHRTRGRLSLQLEADAEDHDRRESRRLRGPTFHITSVAMKVSAAPKGTSRTAIGLATLAIAVPTVSPAIAAGSKQAKTVSASLTRNWTGP